MTYTSNWIHSTSCFLLQKVSSSTYTSVSLLGEKCNGNQFLGTCFPRDGCWTLPQIHSVRLWLNLTSQQSVQSRRNLAPLPKCTSDFWNAASFKKYYIFRQENDKTGKLTTIFLISHISVCSRKYQKPVNFCGPKMVLKLCTDSSFIEEAQNIDSLKDMENFDNTAFSPTLPGYHKVDSWLRTFKIVKP